MITECACGVSNKEFGMLHNRPTKMTLSLLGYAKAGLFFQRFSTALRAKNRRKIEFSEKFFEFSQKFLEFSENSLSLAKKPLSLAKIPWG